MISILYFWLNNHFYILIITGEIKVIMISLLAKKSARLFSANKKPEIDGSTLKEKLHVLKELKPYILPFVHKNKLVTRALLKSYAYLAISKFCFFGGPMFLKHGINNLQNVLLGDPILMFLGYGACYSASILFESLRNI